MNLTITRRGDYALRTALCLAEAWDSGERRKIRDVSASVGVPISYTPQILGLLTRADIVAGRAGPRGGYRLTRDPSRISVLEVVEAAEGPLVLSRCILRGGPCRWEEACAMHATWANASATFRDYLQATSLADIAAEDERLKGRLPENPNQTSISQEGYATPNR